MGDIKMGRSHASDVEASLTAVRILAATWGITPARKHPLRSVPLALAPITLPLARRRPFESRASGAGWPQTARSHGKALLLHHGLAAVVERPNSFDAPCPIRFPSPDHGVRKRRTEQQCT